MRRKLWHHVANNPFKREEPAAEYPSEKTPGADRCSVGPGIAGRGRGNGRIKGLSG